MAQIRVNVVRQDYLVPFATNGARVPGLDASAFTVKMSLNGANVVVSLLDDDDEDPVAGEVKLKEVDGDGTYVIAYLPTAVGELLVVVEYTAGSLRFASDHDVVQQTTTDPAATERVVLKTKKPNGAIAAYCSFDIKDSDGNRLRTGFTDVTGSADLFLPVGTGYTAQVARTDLQFSEETFNVISGTNPNLTVTGSTPSVTLVAS